MTNKRKTYQIFKVDDEYAVYLKQHTVEDVIREIKITAKYVTFIGEFEASSLAEQYIIYNSIIGDGREWVVSVQDYMRL